MIPAESFFSGWLPVAEEAEGTTNAMATMTRMLQHRIAVANITLEWDFAVQVPTMNQNARCGSKEMPAPRDDAFLQRPPRHHVTSNFSDFGPLWGVIRVTASQASRKVTRVVYTVFVFYFSDFSYFFLRSRGHRPLKV
jgi:hypothetical protein